MSKSFSIRCCPVVLGSGRDCHLSCRSGAISLKQCAIESTADGQVVLRVLETSHGTYVNDVRIDSLHRLQSGDRLRIGSLEFEVLINGDQRQGHDRTSPAALASDPVGELVSDLLLLADEEDRLLRLSDPALREYRVEQTANLQSSPDEKDDQPDSSEPQNRKRRFPRKPPGKLPAPPPIRAESTTEAADLAVTRIFEDHEKQRKTWRGNRKKQS